MKIDHVVAFSIKPWTSELLNYLAQHACTLNQIDYCYMTFWRKRDEKKESTNKRYKYWDPTASTYKSESHVLF